MGKGERECAERSRCGDTAVGKEDGERTKKSHLNIMKTERKTESAPHLVHIAREKKCGSDMAASCEEYCEGRRCHYFSCIS